MTDKIDQNIFTGDDVIQPMPPMFRAAVLSCALPMTLGAIGLIPLLFFVVEKLLGLETVWGEPQNVVAIILSLCFLIGAPISARLACNRLKKNTHLYALAGLGFWDVSRHAMVASALVHLFGFLACLVTMSFFTGGIGNAMEMISFGLVYGSVLNVILYGFLTLPFSIYCAAIFHRCYDLEDWVL